MLVFTERDTGTIVHAIVDDKITICLTWKPSTGFSWKEDISDAVVLDEIIHEDGTNLPGADAFVKFVFRILKSGYINLNYARQGNTPTKWFGIEVTIS